jgi:hypothetical protein
MSWDQGAISGGRNLDLSLPMRKHAISGFTSVDEENDSICSLSSYLITYPTTPLNGAPPCVTFKNESSDGNSTMHSSNVVAIPSLRPLIDGVGIEMERIFTVNTPKSKSADSNEDHIVTFSELPVHEAKTRAIGPSGRPPLRKMNIQFPLRCPVQTGNTPGPPMAESSVLAKVLSIERGAISPDSNDAKEYIDAEIVSDDSGVLRSLDRSSMASHDLSSIQTVSRPNFFEDFIFPAVARRAEAIPNPNLHSFKTSRHRVIPSKEPDLTVAHVPNATTVPSGSDLASFSRSLLHAPNETNISLGTALHALAPKELEYDRPSMFQTHSPLVPPPKVQAIPPLRRRKRKMLLDPTVKIKDKYARRKPQSLLTATAMGRPSLATRSAVSPPLRPLIRSSATTSINPTALVSSGTYVTLPSRGLVLDNHFAVTNIRHLSAQADVMRQHVKLHNSFLPAPMICTTTTPATQPIRIPQRNSIETDFTGIPSVDMTIWETLSQPQASRKDSSKSSKVVVDDGGQRKNPSIFRQASKLKRHAQMSRPVLLGTPFKVPEGPSFEDVIPDQSFIPHQRDTQVPSTMQEISITFPLKFETQSIETKVGSLKLPHNCHFEMSTPIVIRPSSQRDIDRTDVLDYSDGDSDIFAAGTKYPLFVPRDLRSRVIFPPLVAPLPSIPIMLSDGKRDSQPSTERIVLGPISAWRRAIPDRLDLAEAPLPGIHSILSLPDQRL